LINHLEGKVTSVMVEKEEIIIKLKSEIVLLKNKLELDEEKF
jgi:predicted  nucleic acid-binding Zn-ribbon protein